MARKMVAAGIMVSMLMAPIGPVLAKSVCYNTFGEAGPVLRIAINNPSTLTTRKEAREYGELHPVQKVWTARGLHIDDQEDTIGFPTGTLHGTVIVGKGVGARMGLTYAHPGFESFGHRSESESAEYACRSDGASPWPDTWRCDIMFRSGHLRRDERFDRIDRPRDVGLCSVFDLNPDRDLDE